MSAETHLPVAGELDGLLNLHVGADVSDLVSASLLDPLREFLSRPAKRFRSRLVDIGYRFAGENAPHAVDPQAAEMCARAASVLESLHAGSLVVDDIQDQSAERRGMPTLHRSHGLATALNAGNWLYFWPLEQIRGWGLTPETEVRLYRVCHEALLRAHFGQAIDVGTAIDELARERIPSVCLASLELKTGALTSLAACLGGVVGGASDARLAALDEFGRRFGIALQMFDDIGNLRPRAGEKRYEDLRLRRPSWIWAVAAETCTTEEFAAFAAAVCRFPETAALEQALAAHDLPVKAKARAARYLEESLQALAAALEPHGDFHEPLTAVRELSDILRQAYE